MSAGSARDPSGYVKLGLLGKYRTGADSGHRRSIKQLGVCIVHRVPEESVKYFLNHYPHQQRVKNRSSISSEKSLAYSCKSPNLLRQRNIMTVDTVGGLLTYPVGTESKVSQLCAEESLCANLF